METHTYPKSIKPPPYSAEIYVAKGSKSFFATSQAILHTFCDTSFYTQNTARLQHISFQFRLKVCTISEHSVSFQKNLERCRCSLSIENFYHIYRTLDISADDCIFQDSHDRTGPTYQELSWLLALCDERSLSVLVATAAALTEGNPHASLFDLEARQT